MAIKEKTTHFRELLLHNAAITTDTTTVSSIIVDTANYDMGIGFSMMASAFTDGVYQLLVEEGNDSGLSDATTVGAEKLVYPTQPTISAATADGDFLPRQGIHSTKRYVRISIVSTGTTSGATIQVLCHKFAEFLPTSQDD